MLSGATVTIYNDQDDVVAAGTTDVSGNFLLKFAPVSSSFYKVKYELLGYFDKNVTYNGALPASITPVSLVKGVFLTFQVNTVGLG